MGIIGPITATAAIVPVAYGLARGERPSTLQGIGVGLAVVGVIAASLEPLPEGRGRQIGAGVGFALVAALASAGRSSASAALRPAASRWATLTMRAAAVPIVLVACSSLKRRAPALSRGWLLLVGVGIADIGRDAAVRARRRRSGLLSVVARAVVALSDRDRRRSRACCSPSGSRGRSSPASRWR